MPGVNMLDQIVIIQNSGKLTRNLVAKCIMQSICPEENETSGMFFFLFSKRAAFVAKKGFMSILASKIRFNSFSLFNSYDMA